MGRQVVPAGCRVRQNRTLPTGLGLWNVPTRMRVPQLAGATDIGLSEGLLLFIDRRALRGPRTLAWAQRHSLASSLPHTGR